MTRKRLPLNDLAVADRLREARHILGLTAAECARQLDFPVSTILNYETHKTPIPAEFALRLCRQFVISEEWFATGLHTALRSAAAAHGIPDTTPFEAMPLFFFHQALDLLTEAQNRSISLRSSYSTLYSCTLAPLYEKLCQEFFYLPRVIMRDSDTHDIIHNLSRVIVARWLCLLDNEAVRCQANPSFARRQFFRAQLEAGHLIWKRFMGAETPEISAPHLAWLRALVADSATPIGPIHALGANATAFIAEPIAAPAAASPERNLKKGVDEDSESRDTAPMKTEMERLIDKVKKLTEPRGMKSGLAEHLGVSTSTISEWLAGHYEPGGQATLKLLQWVEKQRGKS